MAKKQKAPETRDVRQFDICPEGARTAAGSESSDVQIELLQQAMGTIWNPERKTEEQRVQAMQAAYDTLKNIAPRSELEGMLAVQMIGTHNAAMECLRRAMAEGQSMEARDLNLKHATKLMGLYERQLAALDKHRGKGRQKITVEHVNVHAGGQAIVGDVTTGEIAPPSPAPAAAQPEALADESARVSDGEDLAKELEPKLPPARTRKRK
jgi:hypothetical protein